MRCIWTVTSTYVISLDARGMFQRCKRVLLWGWIQLNFLELSRMCLLNHRSRTRTEYGWHLSRRTLHKVNVKKTKPGNYMCDGTAEQEAPFITGASLFMSDISVFFLGRDSVNVRQWQSHDPRSIKKKTSVKGKGIILTQKENDSWNQSGGGVELSTPISVIPLWQKCSACLGLVCLTLPRDMQLGIWEISSIT